MSNHRPDVPVPPLRDAAVDAAWRAASREEPPSALDAAILAAAGRAVAAGPRRPAVREATRPERWWWPLAAAATIGAIAIGILQLGAPDRIGAPGKESAVVTDMPPAPSSTPSPASPATPHAQPASTVAAARHEPASDAVKPRAEATAQPEIATPPGTAARDEIKARRETTAKRQAVPSESAGPTLNRTPARPSATESTPPPTARPDLGGSVPAEDVPTAAPEQRAAAAPDAYRDVAPAPPAAGVASRPSAKGAAVPAPVAQPFPAGGERNLRESEPAAPAALGKLGAGTPAGTRAAAQAQSAASRLPVPNWIALIRKLRAEGRGAEAARELALFRRAHPDHEQLLPEDLRHWKPDDPRDMQPAEK